jgi:hypothetical protein
MPEVRNGFRRRYVKSFHFNREYFARSSGVARAIAISFLMRFIE